MFVFIIQVGKYTGVVSWYESIYSTQERGGSFSEKYKCPWCDSKLHFNSSFQVFSVVVNVVSQEGSDEVVAMVVPLERNTDVLLLYVLKP